MFKDWGVIEVEISKISNVSILIYSEPHIHSPVEKEHSETKSLTVQRRSQSKTRQFSPDPGLGKF